MPDLDDVLRAGTVFDWISPVLAIVNDIRKGPAVTFLIHVACGWTGREIANYLHQNGVETWGHMIINDYFTISCRESQASWARHLLMQAGLPVEG